MQVQSQPVCVFWFRRDLRTRDNHGLWRALTSGLPVLPLFIFDEDILSQLKNPQDARVEFIHKTVLELESDFAECGGHVLVRHGSPLQVWKKILGQFNIQAVYCNHDYEPGACARDAQIETLLVKHNISFVSVKDQVIFERNDVCKDDGKPYTVFTPFSKKWRGQLNREKDLKAFQSESKLENIFSWSGEIFPSLEELGFESGAAEFPAKSVSKDLLKHYQERRNFPGIRGTSHLGLHLRFGTVSIRKMMSVALEYSEAWATELIWREFFMMLLWHFPATQNKAFRPEYDQIQWDNNKTHFKKWCAGQTGYPMVDAGMRELNTTGFMHNRVRMVTASFLCKHLLIDWRWGERYFAERLLDYDMSANVGNWQWAAGCGCDAAPYFRVFNPELQAQKFDPAGKYLDLWVPERKTSAYCDPVVEHRAARLRCLKAYEAAVKSPKQGVKS